MRLGLMIGAAAWAVAGAAAAQPARPWMNARLSPDARAELLLKQLAPDERIALLHGHIPLLWRDRPKEVQIAAGYVPGIDRLGIPALAESDASLGVANAGRKDDDATALPSGLSLASTWNTGLAYEGGAMIGKQARQKGFNVLLAGGVNLARDPRNGRNFEYLGEDPLLAGKLAGAAIRGIQSNHIVSTIKHFALNDQETGRMVLDARIGEAAFRESDLLAFEIALQDGDPGSVMCAYNQVNGAYACENHHLLTDVLRTDWAYRGFVMSDWGAVHSPGAATAGLDQESGQELDRQVHFDAPLKSLLEKGEVSPAQIAAMDRRILRAMFAAGLFDHPVKAGGLDTLADAAVAQRAAEQGIVLLKNEGGLLPLAVGARRIAVIGGHADAGVISGGGSSQVVPKGSLRLKPPPGGPPWGQGIFYHPSAPLAAIRARSGGQVTYDPGTDPAAAAAAARGADVAIVFATQWASEAMDTTLGLDDNQDAVIAAVAAANPHTVVVLETGNPVLMPWLAQVGAVVEAWYPGSRGGEAIARVLYGEVDAAGRLPVSFPTSEARLARPKLPGGPGSGVDPNKAFPVDYPEGSDIGYRGLAGRGEAPLFPFGHGLSYTQFRYGGLKVTGGRTLSARFTVTNVGARAGIDTPQVYLTGAPNRKQLRLIGWSRVALKPGESRRVSVAADPRLLADWDEKAHGWRVSRGAYSLIVGHSSVSAELRGQAQVAAASLKP
jgi:beta-glucosidase